MAANGKKERGNLEFLVIGLVYLLDGVCFGKELSW